MFVWRGNGKVPKYQVQGWRKKVRKELEKRTWEELNKNFPNWKQNPILKREKGTKNSYLKLVNQSNFKIFCRLFEIL